MEKLAARIVLTALALASSMAPRLAAAPAQGSISGVVFHDANANGVQDSGEPGLAGWTATANDGATTLSAPTDGLGSFLITNVSSGTWSVRVTPPVAVWASTTPDPRNVLVGTSGTSPAGGFGFALLAEVPALDGAGAAALVLLLLGGGVVALRRGPRRRPG